MMQVKSLVAVRERERESLALMKLNIWVANRATLLIIAYLSFNYIRDG